MNVHEFNNRRADINRHADAAIAGLEKTAVDQKLTTRQIIERAVEIGRGQARDLAALEQKSAEPE
jgi:hypothetical protein